MYTINYLNCVVVVWVWNGVSNQCNLNSENHYNTWVTHIHRSWYNKHYQIIFLMMLSDRTPRYTSKFALHMHSRSLFKVFQAKIVSSQSTKNYNVCVQSVQQTYFNYVPLQDFYSLCDFLCCLFWMVSTLRSRKRSKYPICDGFVGEIKVRPYQMIICLLYLQSDCTAPNYHWNIAQKQLVVDCISIKNC